MLEETKSSIRLDIDDEKEPGIVHIPDTEFISALGRVSKNDDGKKYMYEAVMNYKKMTANEWKPIIIHSSVTLIGIISVAFISNGNLAQTIMQPPLA